MNTDKEQACSTQVATLAIEQYADILRIQKREAETGDHYMRGLYNGIVMMCSNFDGITYPMMEAPSLTDPATGAAHATKPRELATLNGAQLKELLDAVTGDHDADTEVTLIAYDQPFKSTDGDDMAVGLYFYWTEYPEEGIVPLATHQPTSQAEGK